MVNAGDKGGNLGPPRSWHIRSVPENIQQAVVDMAHDQRVSVGELMTKMVLDLRGAKSDSQPSHASNTAVDADRLLKLLQAAATLPKADLPKADKNAIRATIASELRLLHRDHPAPESQKE